MSMVDKREQLNRNSDTALTIKPDRLWKSLMEMARIGGTSEGGVCRVALTEEDKLGRDLFVRWCEEAGCSITVDNIGNIFACREGRDPNLPPVLMGSHLDSQPSGGRFDGAYGVLAALEVIRALNDENVETESSIEACVWTNEEGSRFSPAMMGSGTFAGIFPIKEVFAKQDITGTRFDTALTSIGYNGSIPTGERPVGTYLEAHIEQGPILEAEEKKIGVLSGGQAMRWYDVVILGQEAHAGSTPMTRRKDALVACSKLVQAVDDIGRTTGEFARSTCGYINASPNSRNTIVGQIAMSVDLRHPDDARLADMNTAFLDSCAQITWETTCKIEPQEIWHCPPTRFDENCINLIRQSAIRNGMPYREMVSGAGHDAFYLARVAPTGMIFIPCSGGISHNPIESATKQDCAAGCQVLFDVAVERANESRTNT